jgi:YD repeat-containing protein
MLTTVYAYDEKGRQVEKTRRMGALSEQHTKYRFDDHDNPIDEIAENTSRDMQMDEQGNLLPSNESSHGQHTRYSYTYDARGNWTERVVWIIFEPAKDFQRSNVERRQITYYPATAP